jgi:hypothetical protein
MSFSIFEDGLAESYFEGEAFARKGATRSEVSLTDGDGSRACCVASIELTLASRRLELAWAP